MSRIEYHEAAEEELLSEIAFLESRSPGLGRRFFAEVARAENLIAQFPESAPEVQPGIRRTRVRKFPVSLIYTVEAGRLVVLAVAHHSRRPGYWMGRTADRG